ncbi:uncharacterized protein LOC144096824 [Amblyomma americanum]
MNDFCHKPASQTAEDAEMSTVEAGAETFEPNGKPEAQPGEEREDTEETEYEGEKLRAPRLGPRGYKGRKCSTPLCRSLEKWFQKTVGRQANPCKEHNTFVCDPTVSFPGFKSSLAKAQGTATSRAGRTKGKAMREHDGSNQRQSADLLESCLEYSRWPNASVDDVLLFLSHLNLDLRRMVDNPAEDPLARMMELSLDYGVEAPVSFFRQYDVTAKASAPYVVKITLHPEVNYFFNGFRSLEEEDILTFYQNCLKVLALLNDNLIAEQLVNADDELSDFLNQTAASSQSSRTTISKLAEATGVAEGQWKQLLASVSRSSAAVYKEVIASEQALTFVAYLSRPLKRLAMRRLLAWHVLRYMAAPSADVLMAANRASDVQRVSSYSVFQGM